MGFTTQSITSSGEALDVTTKGDVQTHDGTEGSRVAVGTNAQVLTADSNETTGLKWATPSAGGNLILVETITLGVAGTSIDFTGLDIATDGYYVLVGVLDVASNCTPKIYFNNDTTAANYIAVRSDADGTTMAVTSGDNAEMFIIGGGDEGVFKATVSQNVDLRATALFEQKNGRTVGGLTRIDGVIMTDAVISNITQITIVGDTDFAINSTVSLYKVTKS